MHDIYIWTRSSFICGLCECACMYTCVCICTHARVCQRSVSYIFNCSPLHLKNKQTNKQTRSIIELSNWLELVNRIPVLGLWAHIDKPGLYVNVGDLNSDLILYDKHFMQWSNFPALGVDFENIIPKQPFCYPSPPLLQNNWYGLDLCPNIAENSGGQS